MSISKTAAKTIAAKSVSIYGRGSSWTITGPYRDSEPHGAYTQSTASNYDRAREKAARWKAGVALALMGFDVDDYEYELHGCDHAPFRRLVDIVAQRLTTRPT